MFPLVHIYTATQVSKKRTPLLVIGSVIPDVVWVNREKIPPEKLHDNLDDFYSYVESKHEDMLDLALGMMLHSNKIGADLYSHSYKGGYSYIKGKEILSDVANLVKTDNSKKFSDLSHNFIEASLDLLLYSDRPEILDLYKKSLTNVDFDKISALFSEYTGIEEKFLLQNIQLLFSLVKPEYLASEMSFANNVLPKMIEIGFNQKVNKAEVLKILQKSVKITKSDYKDLLMSTISMMQKDF